MADTKQPDTKRPAATANPQPSAVPTATAAPATASTNPSRFDSSGEAGTQNPFAEDKEPVRLPGSVIQNTPGFGSAGSGTSAFGSGGGNGGSGSGNGGGGGGNGGGRGGGGGDGGGSFDAWLLHNVRRVRGSGHTFTRKQCVIKATGANQFAPQSVAVANHNMDAGWRHCRRSEAEALSETRGTAWGKSNDGKALDANDLLYQMSATDAIDIPAHTILFGTKSRLPGVSSGSPALYTNFGQQATTVHASLAGLAINTVVEVRGIGPVTRTQLDGRNPHAQGAGTITTRFGGTAMVPVGPKGIRAGKPVVAKMPRVVVDARGNTMLDVEREGYPGVPMLYAEEQDEFWDFASFTKRMSTESAAAAALEPSGTTTDPLQQALMRAYRARNGADQEIMAGALFALLRLVDETMSDEDATEGADAAARSNDAAGLRCRLDAAMIEGCKTCSENCGTKIGTAIYNSHGSEEAEIQIQLG